MNDITVFVYLVFFVALCGMTFAFMFKMMGSVLSDIDRKPVNNYGDAMKAYRPHPEMKDVKDGDELLIFRASEDSDDK